ncbi:LlaJI family restriction endonuclease [uncultured Shewanella sp.]|uniref:LlaJI family restriction endonuclease n=1 Tax=uncultured Shewanella sp. TaxID=173975 RepID=UPI0026327FF6|nr:LlaJI family restriction endonuclease [uncultured Shewanella sp.]
MSHNISIYHDRMHLNSLDKSIKKALNHHHLIDKETHSINFCGLVLLNGEASIFFPRNTVIEDSKKAKLSANLMQAIHLFASQSSTYRISQDGGDSLIGDHQLGLIFSLLEDFQKNGIYSQRLSRFRLNAGKQNWKKTLSHSTAFPARNGPFYFDIWGSARCNIMDSEVSRIHASIIRDIDKNFGWLFDSHHSISAELAEISEPSKNDIDTLIVLLDIEMNLIYSDRDIWLLTELKRYICLVYGHDEKPEVIGVRAFHHMWEHMLGKVLNDTIDINKLLPTPAYKMRSAIGEELIPTRGKSQKTDIVLKDPKSETYCIVDAKYYQASSVNTAPGWSDLVKQFFYVKALKTIVSDSSIINNAFIFPGKFGEIVSAHMVNRDSEMLFEEDYPKIQCHYFCPNVVVEHFIKRRTMSTETYNVLYAF